MPEQAAIKVLVVDDLPEKLLVYRTILEEPGLEVVAANSGQDALRHILQHEFAVILLDVSMPGMDGFETASLIRRRKRSAHTPIIFVTAHTDEVYALRGYSHGAVDYILTPVVPEVLRTKVRVFAELQRLHMQVQAQAERRIQAAEREQAYLSDLVERAGDFVARIDSVGRLISINNVGRAMLGYADRSRPMPTLIAECQPAWAQEQLRVSGLPTAIREGIWFGESALLGADGTELPVSQVVLAYSQPADGADCFSLVARDISERRRIEQELDRHRVHLEDLVRERTAELESSHARLRLADRLAAIGTLAAGLGHDMGNLLLPVQIRLDALRDARLPSPASDDVNAIAEACDYLKRLTRGLRLFALDPEDEDASTNSTDLSTWWSEVAPFLRNVLSKGLALEADIPAQLPKIAVAPHVLTQIAYNLIQNAVDAMRRQGRGRVLVGAAMHPHSCVTLSFFDEGPGMTPDVLARCMEPFFTTKTRGFSTGFGLALVHNAVRKAGGRVEVHSGIGNGSRFDLTFPVATAIREGGSTRLRTTVRIDIADPRMRDYTAALVRLLGANPFVAELSRDAPEPIVVLDTALDRWPELEEYLRADSGNRAIVLGEPRNGPTAPLLIHLPNKPSAAELRSALATALQDGGAVCGGVAS